MSFETKVRRILANQPREQVEDFLALRAEKLGPATLTIRDPETGDVLDSITHERLKALIDVRWERQPDDHLSFRARLQRVHDWVDPVEYDRSDQAKQADKDIAKAVRLLERHNQIREVAHALDGLKWYRQLRAHRRTIGRPPRITIAEKLLLVDLQSDVETTLPEIVTSWNRDTLLHQLGDALLGRPLSDDIGDQLDLSAVYFYLNPM